MKTHSYGFFLLALLMLLASCDLLGVGGDDDGEQEPEPQPRAELVWQRSSLGDLVSAAPLIEDSTVYIVNSFSVARLTLAEGEPLWSTILGSTTPPTIYGKVLADENNLYLRFEQSVTAYNKLDGTQVWSIAFEDSLQGSNLSAGTSLMDQSDTHLFIGTREQLLIVNKQQGSVQQTITLQIPGQAITSTRFNVPVAAQSNDGWVYMLTSFQGQNAAMVNARIAAYSISDGSLVWEQQSPFRLRSIGTILSPTLQLINVNNRLFLMTGPGVVAFDAQSGEQVWASLFVEGRTDINIGSLLVHHENHLYAVAANQIFEVDAASGTKTRQLTVQGLGLVERLFISGNNLFYSVGIGLGDIAIQAVDIETGENRFRVLHEGDFFNGLTPAFSAADSFIVNIGVTSIFGFKIPQ